MKIDNGSNKKNSSEGFSKEKFSDFIKDKKTRWMGIALVVMIAITVAQFVLPNILGK